MVWEYRWGYLALDPDLWRLWPLTLLISCWENVFLTFTINCSKTPHGIWCCNCCQSAWLFSEMHPTTLRLIGSGVRILALRHAERNWEIRRSRESAALPQLGSVHYRLPERATENESNLELELECSTAVDAVPCPIRPRWELIKSRRSIGHCHLVPLANCGQGRSG